MDSNEGHITKKYKLLSQTNKQITIMYPAKNNSKSKSTSNTTTPSQHHQEADIIFPEFHPDILTSLAGAIIPDPYFNHTGTENAYHFKEHCTSIMGTFLCTNTSCRKNGWGSKRVAIRIRGYSPGNGYNAVVFNQRCKSCNELGSLTIDKQSYIERVTYRLKRWAGVEVETPMFNEKKGPDHESLHCEGCKRGVCSWERE